MKKLLCIPLLLLLSGLAFGASVPVCNGTNGPNCTDYFGVGNYANSPLPAGTITGYMLISGGSGYASPWVVVTDPTGVTFNFATTATAGVVDPITAGTGGSGYTMPQVTIVDVGPGGALGAPTCGGASPQPACGTGALATAALGAPFTGGMPKFQAADTLPSFSALPKLAGGLTVATTDTTTFPGDDYYEIALVQYSQKLHSSLPPTTLRGYMQLPTGSTACPAVPAASYLGPVIVAQKNRAVRVKFTNCLPTGAGGNLFIPTDTTYMGAGMGPGGQIYTENRATLHLHGGATPWISDGTPHQWTVPVGESATLQTGDSVAYVPDMFFLSTGAVVPQCSATVTTNCSGGTAAQLPAGATNNPGQGSLTFYWTNQQGGRLMFYHDHAYGITRLNVYAGEAAGYLLVDPTEENTLAAATAPGTVGTVPDLTHLIPLVIQDKTFVPSAGQVGAQDPTWTAGQFGTLPGSVNTGDLWFPHVYTTNQNPNDITGANGFGRWDYGAWFFPPQTSLTAATSAGSTNGVTVPCASAAYPNQTLAPTTACPSCGCPITPNPSGTPEGFMDTPVVNGVAYPVLHVAPAAYRFHILSAGNDRSWNLSWFIADATGMEVLTLPAVPPATGTALPLCTAVNPVTNPGLDMGVAMALLDASGNPVNGTGLPTNCWPNYGRSPGIPVAQTMWYAQGGLSGAPDPRQAGPPWIQIGTEGGLLPSPVVIPATPINYELNTRSITVTNVAVHGLWLGPAERADVIVDFSAFAGKTLIMYNDAPAPVPAFDSRLDYFTGDGDQSPIGGAPNTQPGYGPNTRTIMQVVVDQAAPNTVPFSLTALKAAFASTSTTPGLFATTQPTTIVPEAAYDSAYNASFPNTYASIQANTLTFTPITTAQPLTFDQPCGTQPAAPAVCATLDQKAIQELFTLDYGRMNATLGVELPLTNFLTQTTIPYAYIDPPTELIQAGQTQLWKVTHNGVDTHFIHFHLFNVQVINRMGWDGTLRPPDPNEIGWKDTVRMNPLEDILVALQPITPTFPFPIPDSIRPMDVTAALGTSTQFTGVDPNNLPITILNAPVNFGWEYVWHCHILGHEENDMMRPIVFQVAPPAPSGLTAVGSNAGVTLAWTDNSASETSFTYQRDTTSGFLAPSTFVVGPSSPNTAYGGTIVVTDTTATPGVPYFYRVRADDDFAPASPLAPPFQAVPLSSAWSAFAQVVLPPTVTGVSPNSGSTAGGTAVTITGTNFAAGATVTFGGTAATVTSVTGTTITATTPAHVAGLVAVTVSVNGLNGTLNNAFTYIAPPTVTSVAPTSGSTLGGTAVTITGTNFRAGATVTFGGTAATGITVVNSTTITATTPAHAAGTVNVVVTDPAPPVGGLSGTLANGFTYIGSQPTVTSIAPVSGKTSGGTAVTITGTNFAAGATVTFGTIAATGITVVNSTTITATTPAHAAGLVNVVVTVGGQSGTLTNGFRYAPIAFVRVAAATPQTPQTSVSVAYPAAQAAGNLNIIVVGWNDTTRTVSSVTDSAGNIYSLAIGPTSGTALRQSIYYASNIKAGANTVRVTFSGPATFPDIRILEYSGVGLLDQNRGAAGTGTLANSGTRTTTAANELIFGAATVSSGVTGAGAGFTSRIITNPDADDAEDRVVAAIGTFGATAPLSSGNWVIQMATFK